MGGGVGGREAPKGLALETWRLAQRSWRFLQKKIDLIRQRNWGRGASRSWEPGVQRSSPASARGRAPLSCLAMTGDEPLRLFYRLLLDSVSQVPSEVPHYELMSR